MPKKRNPPTAWEIATFFRDELLPRMRQSFELSREAYREGKTGFLSVLEAQRSYLESLAEYVERRLASSLAIPELERAVGQPMQSIVQRASAEEAETEAEAEAEQQ